MSNILKFESKETREMGSYLHTLQADELESMLYRYQMRAIKHHTALKSARARFIGELTFGQYKRYAKLRTWVDGLNSQQIEAISKRKATLHKAEQAKWHSENVDRAQNIISLIRSEIEHRGAA